MGNHVVQVRFGEPIGGEPGAGVQAVADNLMPRGPEMSHPASASILPRKGYIAADRVGSIELLGAFYPMSWPAR
jgi:hypothetical protein